MILLPSTRFKPRHTRSRLRPADGQAFIARTSFAHAILLYMVNVCAIVVGAVYSIVCLAGNNCDMVYSAVLFMALLTVCTGGYGLDSRFCWRNCLLIHFITVLYYHGDHPSVIRFNPLIISRFRRGHGVLTRMDRITRAQRRCSQLSENTSRSWPGMFPSQSLRVSFVKSMLLGKHLDTLATCMCTALGIQWSHPIGEQLSVMLSRFMSRVLHDGLGFRQYHSCARVVHRHARVRLRGGAGPVQCKLCSLNFLSLPY